MQLHDTMTRETRELSPRDGKVFRFYCCGPTVYGPAHIGNFRTFLLQDVFRRAYEFGHGETLHVRNLTDVDDKTIRDAGASGQGLREFTARWRDKFHADCAALGLLPPHREPSAVDHIPQQVDMIAELVEKGHAYTGGDGSVYFRVTSFDGYGRLSRLDQRELREGASGATSVSDDEYEKDAVADFALWKARKDEDGDNHWPSPWGDGRPGWHLECSAMCREYLGETFDLHSGGVDLVFPHHENEIAQSEACTGTKMADHWFHLTHLLVDGGKMSKSAGNFYTLDDLVEAGFHPVEVRYALISAHYRQPLNFVARDDEGEETFPALASARHALERIARFRADLARAAGDTPGDPHDYENSLALGGDPDKARAAAASFAPAFEALQHDLNTPDALGKLFSAMKTLQPEKLDAEEARRELTGLHFLLHALGLDLAAHAAAREEETHQAVPEKILALAEQRATARIEKNWAEADRLRDEITAAGWTVKDGKEGYEVLPDA